MLHVGAKQIVVILQIGEVVWFDFLGISGEAKDIETVARVSGRDQVRQSQGTFLG